VKNGSKILLAVSVGKGTGLGLSVTHGIVTGHGGTIQVDSKPGMGTRFTIHLPLVQPDGATKTD